MATPGRINGDIIAIYINNQLVAVSTDCSHTLQVDQRETTSKEDGGRYQAEPTKATENLEGNYIVAYDQNNYQQLIAIGRSKQKFTWRMGSTVSGDPYWVGTGFFTSLKKTAPNNGNVTGAYSIQATGTVQQLTNP